jgi:hypothetical protein
MNINWKSADRKPSRILNRRYASDVVKKDGKWKQQGLRVVR